MEWRIWLFCVFGIFWRFADGIDVSLNENRKYLFGDVLEPLCGFNLSSNGTNGAVDVVEIFHQWETFTTAQISSISPSEYRKAMPCFPGPSLNVSTATEQQIGLLSSYPSCDELVSNYMGIVEETDDFMKQIAKGNVTALSSVGTMISSFKTRIHCLVDHLPSSNASSKIENILSKLLEPPQTPSELNITSIIECLINTTSLDLKSIDISQNLDEILCESTKICNFSQISQNNGCLAKLNITQQQYDDAKNMKLSDVLTENPSILSLIPSGAMSFLDEMMLSRRRRTPEPQVRGNETREFKNDTNSERNKNRQIDGIEKMLNDDFNENDMLRNRSEHFEKDRGRENNSTEDYWAENDDFTKSYDKTPLLNTSDVITSIQEYLQTFNISVTSAQVIQFLNETGISPEKALTILKNEDPSKVVSEMMQFSKGDNAGTFVNSVLSFLNNGTSSTSVKDEVQKVLNSTGDRTSIEDIMNALMDSTNSSKVRDGAVSSIGSDIQKVLNSTDNSTSIGGFLNALVDSTNSSKIRDELSNNGTLSSIGNDIQKVLNSADNSTSIGGFLNDLVDSKNSSKIRDELSNNGTLSSIGNDIQKVLNSTGNGNSTSIGDVLNKIIDTGSATNISNSTSINNLISNLSKNVSSDTLNSLQSLVSDNLGSSASSALSSNNLLSSLLGK